MFPVARGSTVTLVLAVILLVSGSLFATTFLVGLETRATQASSSALAARLLSHSAISLTLAELEAEIAVGGTVSGGSFGPWAPDVPRVSVAPYTVGALAQECACLYSLSTSARVGVATSARELVVAVRPGEVSVWLRR